MKVNFSKLLSPKILLIIIIITLCGCLGILFYIGILQFNHPSKKDYPIRGVDVSSYQGTIDWNMLAGQDIQFAFIKATEGSSFKDPCFNDNWNKAADTHLRIGAYHFFSYDSSGETQADNFISSVIPKEKMLPPVVDVEFYGDKKSNPPNAIDVRKNLTTYINKIEKHYEMKPIIYATHQSFDSYIKDNFDEYNIWIRDIFSFPKLNDNRKWTFWQYSNRMVLEGYKGEEKYIDMNVFCGSEKEFKQYTK